MAMGAGMTSAITNPLHVEVIKAVMGADVMLGHDPDCARWIRRFRDAPPPGNGRGCRNARRGGCAARTPRGRTSAPLSLSVLMATVTARDPLIVFMPSGKRGNFPIGHTCVAGRAKSRRGHRFGLRRTGALCGRCQVLGGGGGICQTWRVLFQREPLRPLSEPEMRFSKRAPLVAGAALVLLHAHVLSRCRDRCAGRAARCTGRWCARRPMPGPSSSTPSFACTTSR